MQLNSAFGFFAFFASFVWLVQTIEENHPVEATATTDMGEQKDISEEPDCIRLGGICLEKKNCPSDKVSKDGKCSMQNQLEMVCCHGLSLSESVCQNLGGYCRDICPEEMIIARANDCETGQKCCPLV